VRKSELDDSRCRRTGKYRYRLRRLTFSIADILKLFRAREWQWRKRQEGEMRRASKFHLHFIRGRLRQFAYRRNSVERKRKVVKRTCETKARYLVRKRSSFSGISHLLLHLSALTHLSSRSPWFSSCMYSLLYSQSTDPSTHPAPPRNPKSQESTVPSPRSLPNSTLSPN